VSATGYAALVATTATDAVRQLDETGVDASSWTCGCRSLVDLACYIACVHIRHINIPVIVSSGRIGTVSANALMNCAQ
jgi:hypothetical protein